MMLEKLYPKTKKDLVRAVQRRPRSKIELLDGYTSADERDLIKTAKALSAGSHDLTIILVRS